MDIQPSELSPGWSDSVVNATAQPGRCTDDWESVWYVGDAGITGEVKEPLLANWSDPEAFKLPWDLIANGIFPM